MRSWQPGPHLRDRAKAFVEHVGTSILNSPPNANRACPCDVRRWEADDLFGHLQWVFVRVGFILICDARSLLDARGQRRSLLDCLAGREPTARPGGASDPGGQRPLWDGLLDLFDVLAADGSHSRPDPLAIGARLFAGENTPGLLGATVSDADLLAGFLLLRQGPGACDARCLDWSMLEPRDLGAAYESLLGLEPRIEQASDGRSVFRLERSRQGLRTSSGAFYTPDDLVQHLLDETLSPVIEEVCAGADAPQVRRQAVLSVRLCDPACGCGNFLVPAMHRLADAVLPTLIEEGIHPRVAAARARSLVARACLFGVDIDPLAVELCRCALWLACGDPGVSMHAIGEHIRCGDALVGASEDLVAAGIPDDAYERRRGDEPAQLLKVRRFVRRRRSRLAQPGVRPAAFSKATADAWCAAFFARPRALPGARSNGDAQCRGGEPCGFVTALGAQSEQPAGIRTLSQEQIGRLARRHRFFHWALAFPEVFTRSTPGFDVIVGNPPFLNQLERATATARARAGVIRVRTGGAVRRYVDEALAFLAVCMPMLRSGGRMGLVQPRSVLSASDAIATRRLLLRQGMLRSLWISKERLFEDASVVTCALVLQRDGPRVAHLRRFVGADFAPLDPVRLNGDDLALKDSWAELVAAAMDLPHVAVCGRGRLSDIATATADFRDQYYGLSGFVVEDASLSEADRSDRTHFPPVVTSGLIDLAECRWGIRPTRLLRARWQAPRVDRRRMERDGTLGAWMDARLIPKVLLATQTRVIEVLVDEQGQLLPSVPVVSVMPLDPGMLWLAAAALASPVCCVEALRRYGGAALYHDAIKLSARQCLTLPLPGDERTWERAGEALRRAHLCASGDGDQLRREALAEYARLACEAYGIADAADLLAWWSRRLGAVVFS